MRTAARAASPRNTPQRRVVVALSGRRRSEAGVTDVLIGRLRDDWQVRPRAALVSCWERGVASAGNHDGCSVELL